MAVLSSGSTATCFYIASAETGILVDAGLPFKEIFRRLRRLEESIDKVQAVFISHPHCDHSQGLRSIITNMRCPIYLREAQALGAFADLLVSTRSAWCMVDDSTITVGDLKIKAFPVRHDAIDPVGYVVSHGKCRVAIATDLGEVDEVVAGALDSADLFFLESNYHKPMLEANGYKEKLKSRILESHLSNDAAGAVVERMRENQRVILGHISDNSNSPEIVRMKHAGNPNVFVVGSGSCSEMFYVKG